MAQDLNQEDVLIVRNNETGQVGAVTGLNEDGTPKMADVKSAKLSDLVRFSKGQNPLEAFMSNFVRQCKNPSLFGFFKVPADQYDTVGVATAELAKDPVANEAMLKGAKVDLPEAPAQGVKYSAIDESKIDWPMLKEKWGIDREELEKSGDLKEMLYNRKSGLVTVTPTFAGEKFPIDALLRQDLKKFISLFSDFAPADALLLGVLSYNIGPGAVKRSTVYRKLKSGDRNIFKNYVSFCKYKGKWHKGLYNRRLTELAVLFTP